MICLTGDIHHSSLRTGNQKACDITEIQVAAQYLKLLEEANVKATFFITGKSFAEEWDSLRPICKHPLISVQGHTYSCFEPALFHRVWKKCFHNYNGPAWYQQRDIQKTISIIQNKTGKKITCWRNHMYMHGPNTDKILSQCGIRLCSDGVNKEVLKPYPVMDGLFHFPINVIPDHEHLYHAERTREWVKQWQQRYHWSDCFGSQSYHIEEWGEIVIEGLKDNEKRGAISNMIVHPITMYLCDRFKTFSKNLEQNATKKTLFLDELTCE